MIRREGTVQIWLVLVLAVQAAVLQAVEKFEPEYSSQEEEPWRWSFYDQPEFRDAECLLFHTDGSIWIGIGAKVFRYDGKTVQSGLADIVLPKETLFQLREDSNGRIYSCSKKAIQVLEDNVWKIVFKLPDSHNYSIKWMEVLQNGDVWAGLGVGVLQLRGGVRTLWISTLNVDATDFAGAFDWIQRVGSDEKEDLSIISPLNTDKNIRGTKLIRSRAACRSRDGGIWLTVGDSLYRVGYDEGNSTQWEKVERHQVGTRLMANVEILETSDGMLWIADSASRLHISKFDPWKRLSTVVEIEPLKKSFGCCNAIVQTSDGVVWVCGSGGLLKYVNGRFEKVSIDRFSVSYSEIVEMGELPTGSLCLLSHKMGMVSLDLSNRVWEGYEGLSFQSEGADGSQWFISQDKRVVQRNGRSWTAYGNVIDDPSRVFVTRRGDVWVSGSHLKHAAIASLQEKRWNRMVHQGFGKQIDPSAVFEDQSGLMWFGTDKTGGLLAYPERTEEVGTIKYFPYPKNVRKNALGIAQDLDGTLFAGGRVRYLRNGRIEPYTSDKGNFGSFYTHIAPADDGIWCVNKQIGLVKINNQEPTFFGRNAELGSASISSFLPVDNDQVWLSSESGVFYFDGVSWSQNFFYKNIMRLSNIRSLRAGRNGEVWFNLAEEFLIANKRAKGSNGCSQAICYKRPDNTPETYMVKAPSTGGHRPKENLFFEWAGVDEWNRTIADDLQFSYRLDGGTWSPFTGIRTHLLTGLPVGTHLFEVRARNRDLNIDPTAASVSFTIVGSLWSRPWFIALEGGLVATIIFLVIRLIRQHELYLLKTVEFERDQAKQKQKLDRFRLEFFTNISHELRSPLTLILGPLENLLNVEEKPEKREQLGIARRSASRLQYLINQLLDMRKLQAGKLKLELAEDDIVRFVQALLEPFDVLALRKMITLRFTSQLSFLKVQFDPDKLEKILSNLLSNALKFTPDGGSIDIGLYTENFMVWVSVEDTGPGVDAAYRETIFDRFGQAPSSSDVQGSGIGLALTRELVELHGGSIFVRCPELGGSIFTFCLPLVQQPESILGTEDLKLHSPKEENSDEEKKQKVTEGQKILVIDDHADMRRFIRLELENDYLIREAEDGEQGYRIAIEWMPDLIVSDVMMPKVDGFELCGRLKGDLATSHIPIILLTARGSHDARIEGLETGADDYIVKPFNAAILKLRIRNIIEMRRRLQKRFTEQATITPEDITTSARDEEFIRKAVDIIEIHLGDVDFNGEIFAIEMGVSLPGLYKKLKVITGKSVNLFIRSVRLKRAAQMLLEGNLSVSEISVKTGFSGHSYFTRCFTKEFGMSPSGYLSRHTSR